MSINIPTAHKAKVHLPYGSLGPLVEWCERNCTSDWRFMESIDDQWNEFVFLFESDRDYVAFLLWNK